MCVLNVRDEKHQIIHQTTVQSNLKLYPTTSIAITNQY